MSSGGDNIELTEDVHPTLKDIAVQAAASIPGTELAGVDLLLEDHTKSVSEQNASVCEVNGRPGISAHEFPMYGPPRAVAKTYVEHLAQIGNVELGAYKAEGIFKFTLHGKFNAEPLWSKVQERAQLVDASIDGEPNTASGTFTFTVACPPAAAAVLSNNLVSPMSSRIATLEACRVSRVG